MQIPEFFTFAMYVYELTFPTFLMGFVVAVVQRGAASMLRIDELLSETAGDRGSRRCRRGLASCAARSSSGGSPSATRARTARPRCATSRCACPRAPRLGVVGAVGSGKSTLACVIPRLFEVEDGQLFVDGIDINRIPLRTLRGSIAMVPQDSFLFSMTLAENIAFGRDDASPRA